MKGVKGFRRRVWVWKGLGSRKGDWDLRGGWRVSEGVKSLEGSQNMGAEHLDKWGCLNIYGGIKTYGVVWMPPKLPHTSKLKFQAKSCSTAVVTVFLSSSGLGGGQGV